MGGILHRLTTSPPTARHSHTQKQARTREPTNHNGCDRSLQIRRGDWRGDREPDHPPNQRSTAIRPREPLQLDQCGNGNPDAGDASDEGSGEEPGLPAALPRIKPATAPSLPGPRQRRTQVWAS